MCLLICKFVVIAYISVQNILFYNKRLKWGKNPIFCCCLATENAQNNYVNFIVVFAFMGRLCNQISSPTTNITNSTPGQNQLKTWFFAAMGSHSVVYNFL